MKIVNFFWKIMNQNLNFEKTLKVFEKHLKFWKTFEKFWKTFEILKNIFGLNLKKNVYSTATRMRGKYLMWSEKYIYYYIIKMRPENKTLEQRENQTLDHILPLGDKHTKLITSSFSISFLASSAFLAGAVFAGASDKC